MIKAPVIKIEIVTGDSRPMFKQIIDGIRMEIATGRLSAGSKLPSYRGMAMQLLINPNTVAKAYAELSSEGLIESKPGLGLFVVENKPKINDGERKSKLHKAIDSFVSDTVSLNYSEKEIINELKIRLKKLNIIEKSEEHNDE